MLYLYFALDDDEYSDTSRARNTILKQGFFSIILITGVAYMHNNVERKKYDKKAKEYAKYTSQKDAAAASAKWKHVNSLD